MTNASAIAAASTSHSAEYDRTEVYEMLYSTKGYHADLNVTHAQELIDEMLLTTFTHTDERARTRVLDFGCSHGRGVQLLWEAGFRASGTDLARTAIFMALMHRAIPAMLTHWLATADPCNGEACFKVASPTRIPWADASFDAIMTTDVLEHVPPALLPTVLSEFSRITKPTRSWLFIGVSTKVEHRKFAGTRLHETVQNGLSWKATIEQGGAGWRCALPPVRVRGWTRLSTAWLRCERR